MAFSWSYTTIPISLIATFETWELTISRPHERISQKEELRAWDSSQPTLCPIKPKELLIRNVNRRSSEAEIDCSILISERAGNRVLIRPFIYCRGEEREKAGKECGWEVAECGAGVGDDGLVDGRCCDRFGDAGPRCCNTKGCHVDPVSGNIRLSKGNDKDGHPPGIIVRRLIIRDNGSLFKSSSILHCIDATEDDGS